MEKHIGDLPEESVPDYCKCAEVVWCLHTAADNDEVEEEDLILLGLTPDCATPNPAQCFHTFLREKLYVLFQHNPVVLLVENRQEIQRLFANVEREDTAQSVAKLLKAIFSATTKNFFYKWNVHSGLGPMDLQEFFVPIIKQANELQQAFTLWERQRKSKEHIEGQNTLRLPSVTVFFDEVNTSSCLGLFKEVIVDRTLDGEPIPDTIFIVAACNPHRGNSLAVHEKKQPIVDPKEPEQSGRWLSSSYYVRQLHPTFEFLKWDYGSLDESQETAYVTAKMKMLDNTLVAAEVSSLSELIVESQKEMREYAKQELVYCHTPKDAAEHSKCCVSQRDIQRVFVFYEKLMNIYTQFSPYGKEQDYNRRATVVALGIVYYMRLSTKYRNRYEKYLDGKKLLGEQVSFSKAFEDDMNWFIDRISLPPGIAKTRALKENLFAIIMCTMTRTPLIITGAPGSSKTLSFNLALANLRGKESKNPDLRDTRLFPKLDQYFYQCSRRTTANEIEKVYLQAVNRQYSRTRAKLPIYCVMFMDEAGLPPARHEALKVLHSPLDKPKISFVAITNNILDAAKSNRAVSLFRPDKSTEELETLAKGCLCSDPQNPPPQLKDDIERIVNFCPAYQGVIQNPMFTNFFGLRDFIYFICFLRRKIDQGGHLSPQLVLQGLERNFNGVEDAAKIVWNVFLSTMNANMDDLKPRSVLKVLDESLHDRSHGTSAYNEVRYKLIIDPSEDDSLVRLLFHCGVLKEEKTHLYMCSDFPGDGQLQKINTIAAIRHSALQGHTVLLSQTDDIHECFYDLFNLRFQRIEYEDGTRYFTHIAIGPTIKPIRIHKNFQCVVVIKASEVKRTPTPFLNRFEKYYISHKALLSVAMKQFSPAFRELLQNALQKSEEFINCMESSLSFYGLRQETLHSLAITTLPFEHKYTRHERELADCDNKHLYFMRALLYALKRDAHFYIPHLPDAELELDARSVFHLVQSDREMASRLENMTNSEGDTAIDDALMVLHNKDQPCDETGAIAVSLDTSIVIYILQQWLIRYFCKTLMQLMTTEALVYHQKKIPSSYLENYLKHQHHFSLRDLITRYCQSLDQENQSGLSSPTESLNQESHGSLCCTPTKLLCITRSSALVQNLPATYPPSAVSQSKCSEKLLKDLVYSKLHELVVCKLSNLPSQSSIEDMLSEFVKQSSEQPKRVLVITANMQETSKKMINHLRIMIEKAETEANINEPKRLFVVLLHFPPSMLFDVCYPSLFLHGWSHTYLDSIGHVSNDTTLSIGDWLQLSCFGAAALPHPNKYLMPTLKAIRRRPDAVAMISSLTPSEGSFSGPMTAAQRSQRLQELLEEKGVGEALSELFISYWKPPVMIEYLERAAASTYNKASTLSITDSLGTEFKSKFLDFLIYIIARINEDFNIDIMFEDNIPKEVTELFIAIVRMHPLPELSQLRSHVVSLMDVKRSPPKRNATTFPFFRLVSDRMEQIIEESLDDVNQELEIGIEEHQTPSSHDHSKKVIYEKMLDKVDKRILALFQSDEKESLSPAIKAMANNEVWERYFTDFIHKKLHIPRESTRAGLHMSTEVLKAYFGKVLSLKDPLKCFAHLHITVNVFELDFTKLSTILRTLNEITEIALVAETPLSPDSTLTLAGRLVDSVKKTGQVIGTAEDFTTFVVNALFNAMCGTIADENINDKLNQWYRVYHWVVSMPTFAEFTTATAQPSPIMTKFVVMQVLYLLVQSQNLEDDHLRPACEAVDSLCQFYFTKSYQLKVDQPPLLRDVAAKVFEYLGTIDSQDQVEQGRHIMEGLFSHFFSPHTPQPYNLDDCQWFLEFANRQKSWSKNMQYFESLPSTQPQLHQLSSEVQHEACVSMNVFKMFLLRILQHKQEEDQKVNAGPLGIYKPKARELVGKALTSNTALGQPAKYIPPFYQQLPFKRDISCEENDLMQQPLAHLYFICVFECLSQESLSFLTLAADKSAKYIQEGGTQTILVYIEIQAILQAFLKALARDLDPDDSNVLKKLFSSISMETLNTVIADEFTGGVSEVETHGLILTLHILREFKSIHKLLQLLVSKYDVICSSIACLQPVHAKLQEGYKMLSCLHLLLLGERDSKMYDQVSKEMWAVHRSQDFEGFVQTALKFCGSATSEPTGREGLKRNYVMVLWMCSYFGFFDKNVSSKHLVVVINEHLSGLQPEYIQLIRFFLLARSTDSRVTAKEPSDDHLFQLFCPPTSSGVYTQTLCHSIALLAAVVIGSPAQSNPFWYLMFAADELPDTYNLSNIMGYVAPSNKSAAAGEEFVYVQYWRNALKGPLSIHSHCLLQWANLSAICVALLTQPEAETKIASISFPNVPSVHEFCAEKLREVWRTLQKSLHISEEQCFFLVTSCMKRLLHEMNTLDPLSSPSSWRFETKEQLLAFEEFWHNQIFMPAWTHLKENFMSYTQLSSSDNCVFQHLRQVDTCYPIFPSKQFLTEEVLAMQSALNPKSPYFLLAEFVLNYERLRVGGALLPKLIEFYKWLHSQLAYQLTYEQAETYTAKQIVDVAARRCSSTTRDHLLALYKEVKDEFNKYINLSGGTVSLTESSRETFEVQPLIDDDTTKIIELLTTDATKSVGVIHTIITHLITSHNNLLMSFKKIASSEEDCGLKCYLPDTSITSSHPTEVSDNTAIVCKAESGRGASDAYFLQLVRSRCHLPGSSVGGQADWVTSRSILGLQTEPLVDLAKLQSDVVKEYFTGKPLIQCFEPQQFRFRDSLPSSHTLKTSLVGPSLDLGAISMKLPHQFKHAIIPTFKKSLEFDFHSCTFHTLHEVVTGLRTVSGHLIKAQVDEMYSQQITRNRSELHSQTLSQFLDALYPPKGSLEGIGIQNLTWQQVSSLETMKLEFIYETLSFFVRWISEGVYDFYDLPYSMKFAIPEDVVQTLQNLPSKYEEDIQQLLLQLNLLCEALKHSGISLKGTIGDDVQAMEPITKCIGTIPPGCERLCSLIPETVHVRHYVALQLLLRRLKQSLEEKQQPDVMPESVTPWTEDVLDKVVQMFIRRKTTTLLHKPSKEAKYGFLTGIQEEPTFQSDLAKLVNRKQTETSTDEPVEEVDETYYDSSDSESHPSDQKQDISDIDLEERAKSYETEDVKKFLLDIGLQQYIETFEKEGVTGADVLSLPDDALEEDLEVKSPLHRLKIQILFKRRLLNTDPKYPVQYVVTFLKSVEKFSQYAKTFEENEIDSEMLLNATPEVLEELGVTKKLHKTQIRTNFEKYNL